MENWKIQRDRTRCTEAACPLAGAAEYWAVLELPACVRRDLCATCFHRRDQRDAARSVYWKCHRRTDGRRGPTLDLVALRLLFDKLGAIEGERAQGLRYFVTLLLLRKRVLRLVDPRNAAEERADLVVVDPKVEGMTPVALVAPELDPARLADVEGELLAALASDDASGAAAQG